MDRLPRSGTLGELCEKFAKHLLRDLRGHLPVQQNPAQRPHGPGANLRPQFVDPPPNGRDAFKSLVSRFLFHASRYRAILQNSAYIAQARDERQSVSALTLRPMSHGFPGARSLSIKT